MRTRATIAIGVGAGVLAIGAAVGVGALAANLAGGQDDPAQQAGYGQGGFGGGGRSEGRGGLDTTQLATALAEKLGVDEAKVETALQEVMTRDRPSGEPSAQPTAPPSGAPGDNPGGRGGQFLESIATGLAEKLGLDEATVLSALQEVWPDQAGSGAGAPSGQPSRK